MRKSRRSEHIEHRRSASSVLYWSTILFLTMMNFFVAVILVPFFLAAPTIPLYLIVAVFGLLFGQLFNVLITRLEFLERKHHFFAAVFIPLIAIIALLAVLSLSENIASTLRITLTQNPKITVLIYIAAFLAPNTLSKLFSK